MFIALVVSTVLRAAEPCLAHLPQCPTHGELLGLGATELREQS